MQPTATLLLFWVTFTPKPRDTEDFCSQHRMPTGASMQNDQQQSTTKKMLSCLSIVSLLWQQKVALHVFISITEVSAVLPLWHDLVGVWKIAVYVLHLERVGIADLVVRSAIVGAFDHNDITSWTPQINGVTLARQLSPHQAKWQGSSTEPWGRREGEGALSVRIEAWNYSDLEEEGGRRQKRSEVDTHKGSVFKHCVLLFYSEDVTFHQYK